jgi:3-isopropylmalate/(R)-2-methylmalate dehydratase small subunit
VIAPSFGAIFSENAVKNGLLTVQLSEAEVQRLADEITRTQGASTVTVDLEACKVMTQAGRVSPFTISLAVREALLNGIDEIERTQQQENRIRDFQHADRAVRPWVYKPGR